jgi:flavin-dependent dehydrogenase
LTALGIGDLPERAGAIPLEEMRLHHRGTEARLRLAGWTALSRRTLDAALVKEAERAGVTFRGSTCARLGPAHADARIIRLSTPDGDEPDVTARVLIDATGLGRGLAADGHAATEAAPGARVGIGVELAAPRYPVQAGELHMAVGRSGYVGLVRVEGGLLNVAAAVDAERLRASTTEGAVAQILSDAGLPPLPPDAHRGWRGTPRLDRSGSDVGAERLLRLGDAAGYVEPFTGEGIGWALGDGRAAAHAARVAVGGAPGEALALWRAYRAARRSSAERLCRVLARGLRRPWVVSVAFAAVRAVPALAAPLVRRAGRSPLGLAAAHP